MYEFGIPSSNGWPKWSIEHLNNTSVASCMTNPRSGWISSHGLNTDYSYNTVKHSVTGFTHFELVYGVRPPNILTNYVPGNTKVQAVDKFLYNRELILKDLR